MISEMQENNKRNKEPESEKQGSGPLEENPQQSEAHVPLLDEQTEVFILTLFQHEKLQRADKLT